MGKTYNIVLNSGVTTENTTVLYSVRFFYDWTKIEKSKYKCSFTFVGSKFQAGLPSGVIGNISIDLGQSNCFIASSNVPTDFTINKNYTPQYIGSCDFASTFVSPGTYLTRFYADEYTNPPIYLDKRPPSNAFTVFVRRNNDTAFDAPLANFAGQYTLTLHLEQID